MIILFLIIFLMVYLMLHDLGWLKMESPETIMKVDNNNGIDMGVYPNPRTFTFGVRMNF